MTTKSQTDNTEWLDDIIFAHNSRIDSYHHSIREKGLTPDERLAGEDNIAITTKQAILAKLKEQDIKSRIDELESFEGCPPILVDSTIKERLAKLRSLL